MDGKSVSAWFDRVVADAVGSAPDVVTDDLLYAIGAAADEAGDTSMRRDEGYEEFERRRFRGIGHGALAAIEAAEIRLISTKEDAARLEKVARALARSQLDYEAMVAEFEFAKNPDKPPPELDMDEEVEALWPDYTFAARAAIKALLGEEK